MAVSRGHDIAALQDDGYLVLREAVPPENCQAAVDAIFATLGMASDDREDWHREPHRTNGFVELYHNPSLSGNRQEPRIQAALARPWGERKLRVPVDRAGLKPPPHSGRLRCNRTGYVRRDADTSMWPLPCSPRDVCYLADAAKDRGGYQRAPGLQRPFDAPVKARPADRDLHNPYVGWLKVSQIEGKQGDVLIRAPALPTGDGVNISGTPRFAQCSTMLPAGGEDPEARQQRVDEIGQRKPPPRARTLLRLDRW